MDDVGIITGVTIGPKDAPLMSGRGGRFESENGDEVGNEDEIDVLKERANEFYAQMCELQQKCNSLTRNLNETDNDQLRGKYKLDLDATFQAQRQAAHLMEVTERKVFEKQRQQPRTSRKFDELEFVDHEDWDHHLDWMDKGIPRELCQPKAEENVNMHILPNHGGTRSPMFLIRAIRSVMVRNGEYGARLADIIRSRLSPKLVTRLDCRPLNKQHKPSAIVKFLVETYDVEHSEERYEIFFRDSIMKPDMTYSDYFEELIYLFNKADPENSLRFGPKSQRKVVAKFMEGMRPGNNAGMKDFVQRNIMERIREYKDMNQEEFVTEVKGTLEFCETLPDKIRPISAPRLACKG